MIRPKAAVTGIASQTGETLAHAITPSLKLNPGGMLAGTAAAFEAAFGAGTSALGIWLFVAFACDLFAGLSRSVIETEVDWRRFAGGVLGKMMLFLLIPISAAVQAAAETLQLHLHIGDFGLVTVILVGLIVSEAGSVYQHLAAVAPNNLAVRFFGAAADRARAAYAKLTGSKEDGP